jgi:putative ABC transport system permease protein
MIYVGLKLLLHDGPKFVAMVLAVALASFLIQNQASILATFLGLAGSQIRDVTEANIWVMETDTECFDQSKPMRETAVAKVRGVPGVAWATALTKVDTSARTLDGKLNTVTVLGVPEDSRIGEPKMKHGLASSIYERDSVVVDQGGMALLFPGQEFREGMKLRIHDRWLKLRGVSEASPPFTGFPVLHTAANTARDLNREETRSTTFVLARSQPDQDPEVVAKRVAQSTRWKALTSQGFAQASSDFYASQGVPSLFYITISIGLVVGIAFTVQTFRMFVKEHSRAFITLKVLGFTHGQLAAMLFCQGLLILFLGLAFGTALAVGVTQAAQQTPFLRGLYIPWQVALQTAVAIAGVTLLAAGFGFLNIRKLEPAEVFRA